MKKRKQLKILKEMIAKHKVDIIAIGNGTASRESEQIVAEMLKTVEGEVFIQLSMKLVHLFTRRLTRNRRVS